MFGPWCLMAAATAATATTATTAATAACVGVAVTVAAGMVAAGMVAAAVVVVVTCRCMYSVHDFGSLLGGLTHHMLLL